MGLIVRNHELLSKAIVRLLNTSDKIWPSWEIEEILARQFEVTSEERALIHPEGCPVFEKDIAFGLNRAVRRKQIQNLGKRRAPNGGERCLYRIKKDDERPKI
jgi:hypothetical protein